MMRTHPGAESRVLGWLSRLIVDFLPFAALGYRYGVPEAIFDTRTWKRDLDNL